MRNSSMPLPSLFERGGLLHPVPEDELSYIDLIRYISRLNGCSDIPAPRVPERRLPGFIGVPRHLVFVLADGMGLNVFSQYPRGGFLERGFSSELRALFPSTTANVLSATASGRWPAENGITGWWTHLPEYGRTIAPLPFIERGTHTDAHEFGLSLEEVIEGSVTGRADDPDFRRSRCIVPSSLREGAFTRWAKEGHEIACYEELEDIPTVVEQHIRSAGTQTYTDIYLPEVDTLSHEYGPNSHEVGDMVARIDRLLATMADTLPVNSRIVVTADHGQVSIPPELHFCIYDGDPLLEYLSVPPSGEATVPIFHVRPGLEDDFCNAFADRRFGSYFALVSPEEASEYGLFGPTRLSEAMRRRLGTWMGIATEPTLLDYAGTDAGPLNHRGSHGGLRADEMRLGLFVQP